MGTSAACVINGMYPIVQHEVLENEVKLKHPFSLVLAGARRTGKTQLIKNIILNSGRIINPPIKHVIWFFASEQAEVFIEISKELGNGNVEFV